MNIPAYTSSMGQFTKAPEQQELPDTAVQQTQEQAAAQAQASQKVRARSRKSAGAFRTISEVAKELGVQQHVLRFWETKFSQVRPLKRGGGRRYYRPEDVMLLKRIHELLYTEGYTIKGVQKLLREQGKNAVLDGGREEVPAEKPAAESMQIQEPGLNENQKEILETMLDELKELREMVVGDSEEEQASEVSDPLEA